MNLLTAINGRRSVRGYKPDPVSRQELEYVVKNAIWAPNWGNTQPWEIAVIGHDIVNNLSEEFVKKVKAGETANPDLDMPSVWPDVHKNRYVSLGRSLFTSMGIERGDKEARQNHYFNMYRFFGAPNAIYIYMDKGINVHYGPFDIGALSNNICMLAHEKGLGTCILACVSHYPDVVRKYINIPDDKKIVIGIAVGYPDENHSSANFKSTRDEDIISWHGF